jgi:hypothetical protein
MGIGDALYLEMCVLIYVALETCSTCHHGSGNAQRSEPLSDNLLQERPLPSGSPAPSMHVTKHQSQTQASAPATLFSRNHSQPHDQAEAQAQAEPVHGQSSSTLRFPDGMHHPQLSNGLAAPAFRQISFPTVLPQLLPAELCSTTQGHPQLGDQHTMSSRLPHASERYQPVVMPAQVMLQNAVEASQLARAHHLATPSHQQRANVSARSSSFGTQFPVHGCCNARHHSAKCQTWSHLPDMTPGPSMATNMQLTTDQTLQTNSSQCRVWSHQPPGVLCYQIQPSCRDMGTAANARQPASEKHSVALPSTLGNSTMEHGALRAIVEAAGPSGPVHAGPGHPSQQPHLDSRVAPSVFMCPQVGSPACETPSSNDHESLRASFPSYDHPAAHDRGSTTGQWNSEAPFLPQQPHPLLVAVQGDSVQDFGMKGPAISRAGSSLHRNADARPPSHGMSACFISQHDQKMAAASQANPSGSAAEHPHATKIGHPEWLQEVAINHACDLKTEDAETRSSQLLRSQVSPHGEGATGDTEPVRAEAESHIQAEPNLQQAQQALALNQAVSGVVLQAAPRNRVSSSLAKYHTRVPPPKVCNIVTGINIPAQATQLS